MKIILPFKTPIPVFGELNILKYNAKDLKT